MLELATLHSFWFIFGLGVGVVVTCILLMFMSFLDDKPRETRHKKELEAAKKEAYDLAREWCEAEQQYFEMLIDDLRYDIEELQAQVERLERGDDCV